MGGSWIAYGEGREDMESRFRDRRGREHYDNGRFAPMRSVYDTHDDEMRMEHDEPESRRYRRYRNGRFAPRSEHDEPWDNYGESHYPMPAYVPPIYEERDRRMNPIGFAVAGNMEADREYRQDAGYHRMNEMERRAGIIPMKGGAMTHGRKFDKPMAEAWMRNIQNEDGRQGPRWSEDQTRQVMKQRSIDCDPIQFWVAMNVMYADYGKIFAKYGMGDRIDFFADMAKAFLDDKDAVEDKLGRYYECVVEH